MSTTPSKPMAALWMAGWLSMMLVMAIAGRDATHELLRLLDQGIELGAAHGVIVAQTGVRGQYQLAEASAVVLA